MRVRPGAGTMQHNLGPEAPSRHHFGQLLWHNLLRTCHCGFEIADAGNGN